MFVAGSRLLTGLDDREEESGRRGRTVWLLRAEALLPNRAGGECSARLGFGS